MQTNEQMKRNSQISGQRDNGKTVAMSIQKEIIVLQSTYSQFIYFIFGVYIIHRHKLSLSLSPFHSRNSNVNCLHRKSSSLMKTLG